MTARLRFSRLLLLILSGITPLFLQGQPCIDTFPYIEDFEASNGGWSSAAITSNGFGPNSWVWATPNNPVINSAASGTKCWILGTNAFVLPPLVPYAYAPNEYSAVISPCFDFSNLQNPGIIVNVWWESEFSIDGTVLQASTDGGTTWQRIGKYGDPINWYNDNTITGGISGPGGQLHGWTGSVSNGTGSGGWRNAQHALNGLAGEPNVILRFAFAADGSGGANSLKDGFAFDDIFIADMPVVQLPNDTTLCFGENITLNACTPGATSYSWNTNPVVDTFCTKTVFSTGSYIITVEDTIGFVIRDTFNLFVSPTNAQLPPDQLICPGDTLLLNAMNGTANHLWLPDSTTSQFLEVWETGTYTVQVSDQYGCVSIDSILVSVDFVPDVNLGADTAICAGDNLILDAGSGNPGITYQWSPIAATTQTVFISSPGVYSVVVTTAGNCTAGDTIDVDVALAPVVNLGPDRTICESFTLNAGNPGASFLWSPTGDTTQTLTVTQGGTYSVTVVNSLGCDATDQVQIAEGAIPVVDLGPDAIVCDGQPAILDPGLPNQTYFWSTGDTTQTLVTDIPGTYILVMTNADGCSGQDTIEVNESTLAVDLGPDLTICEGQPVTLDAGTAPLTYVWSTGETDQTIQVASAGTYIVTVGDDTDCLVSDTLVVASQSNFTAGFDVSGDFVLYDTLQFSDQSSGNPTSWFWDFGDGNTATGPNPTHAYQSLGTFTACVTVSDGVCENTVCEEVNIAIFQSLEDELGLEWSIHPNPNSGQFWVDIQLARPADLELSLIDLAGKEVWLKPTGQVTAFREWVQPEDLAKGMYLLRLRAGRQSVYRKVLIH